MEYKQKLGLLVTCLLAVTLLYGCARVEKATDIMWGEDMRDEVDPAPYKMKRRPPANDTLQMPSSDFPATLPNAPRSHNSGSAAPMADIPLDLPNGLSGGNIGGVSPITQGDIPQNEIVRGYQKDYHKIQQGTYSPFEKTRHHEPFKITFEPMAYEGTRDKNSANDKPILVTASAHVINEKDTQSEFPFIMKQSSAQNNAEQEISSGKLLAPNQQVDIVLPNQVNQKVDIRKQDMFPLSDYAPKETGKVNVDKNDKVVVTNKIATKPMMAANQAKPLAPSKPTSLLPQVEKQLGPRDESLKQHLNDLSAKMHDEFNGNTGIGKLSASAAGANSFPASVKIAADNQVPAPINIQPTIVPPIVSSAPKVAKPIEPVLKAEPVLTAPVKPVEPIIAAKPVEVITPPIAKAEVTPPRTAPVILPSATEPMLPVEPVPVELAPVEQVEVPLTAKKPEMISEAEIMEEAAPVEPAPRAIPPLPSKYEGFIAPSRYQARSPY